MNTLEISQFSKYIQDHPSKTSWQISSLPLQKYNLGVQSQQQTLEVRLHNSTDLMYTCNCGHKGVVKIVLTWFLDVRKRQNHVKALKPFPKIHPLPENSDARH